MIDDDRSIELNAIGKPNDGLRKGVSFQTVGIFRCSCLWGKRWFYFTSVCGELRSYQIYIDLPHHCFLKHIHWSTLVRLGQAFPKRSTNVLGSQCCACHPVFGDTRASLKERSGAFRGTWKISRLPDSYPCTWFSRTKRTKARCKTM